MGTFNQVSQIRSGIGSIAWDDAWHRIEVNGRVLNLSPTQYRLCRAFLTVVPQNPNITGTSTDILILSYLSFDELQRETELPSRQLLTKHLSRLNARLACVDFHICPMRVQQMGFILTALSPSALSTKSGRRR
ncbi:hypothetical protein [Dictyobacter formicarum]|uniref:OmpR/PhoB-type domain-containing protein n=1 Tax=Dictyobacter formicarum TaxID=2778368 RepID=A0ABQ3VRX7_9CHLR|nr:hypothetical protein [Dictyobacter formicarum]GHO88143.1 hypothetical protein KSZ_61490 [Dictyobacter formicarum]GHO88263.1 hypothetical protein KSZ_62690 [Dictyobacter formicarum]